MNQTASTMETPAPVLYFIQDSRGNVGNNLMFWGIDGKGYTSDLRKAGQYTEKEAWAQHHSRISDIPWPVDYVLARQVEEVDMQHVREEEAQRASGADGYYVEAEPRRYAGNSLIFEAASGRDTSRRDQAKLLKEGLAVRRLWPASYLAEKWRPVANEADMDLKHALGEAFSDIVVPKPPERERYRCVGCGIFMSLNQFWDGACTRCHTDNRP